MSKKTKLIEIPEDAKVFEFRPVVQVCGACAGTGIIFADKLPHDCEVCHATGRIVKEKTIIMTIRPYM